MNIRILCLNILVLFATSYIVSVPQILFSFRQTYKNKNQNDIYLTNCIIVGIVVLTLTSFLVPINFHNIFTSKTIFYSLAIVLAPVLIGFEYLVGMIILKFSKIKFKGMSVNKNWKNVGLVGCMLTLLFGIVEEVIYRQLWSIVILDNLKGTAIVFIVVCSIAYGFNHLHYGFSTFMQKTITGVLLSILFLISGRDLIIPIIAHTSQNIIILLMGRFMKNE